MTQRLEARRSMPPSHVVVAIAYRRMSPFELGVAMEVFSRTCAETGPDWYRFALAHAEPSRNDDLPAPIDGGFELLDQASTIVIPGWSSPHARPPDHLLIALRRAHARGARLVSFCIGTFVLAAAGILAGRRATTHLRFADILSRTYPDIEVVPDVLYVDEGDVLTAAGGVAAIDLGLHIIRRDHGMEAANSVAQRLVAYPHRHGSQVQHVERPVASAHKGARLGLLLDMMRSRLHESHTPARLAGFAGMSERTLRRRFKEATGSTPGEWLLNERLYEARSLLETTDWSVENVAARCGLVAGDRLRHHFRQRFGLSPSDYRALHHRRKEIDRANAGISHGGDGRPD